MYHIYYLTVLSTDKCSLTVRINPGQSWWKPCASGSWPEPLCSHVCAPAPQPQALVLMAGWRAELRHCWWWGFHSCRASRSPHRPQNTPERWPALRRYLPLMVDLCLPGWHSPPKQFCTAVDSFIDWTALQAQSTSSRDFRAAVPVRIVLSSLHYQYLIVLETLR